MNETFLSIPDPETAPETAPDPSIATSTAPRRSPCDESCVRFFMTAPVAEGAVLQTVDSGDAAAREAGRGQLCPIGADLGGEVAGGGLRGGAGVEAESRI